eukprot:TRINITY_DN7126_c0_g1_i1.p1 TRINITY_DN7126_c0_g1~~TRINITY_DN7126_c0_g1_i1.p1  ORF type:complete len:555 (+),score=91.25 TRINITY_DN7126_c0_g1_i1:231-1667(+)
MGLEYVQQNAIVNKEYTLDQLHYKLKKINFAKKHQWFEENVNFRTNSKVSLSFVRFMRKMSNLPEFTAFQLSQKMKFPLSENHILNLTAALGTSNGKGTGELTAEYQYHITKSSHLLSTVILTGKTVTGEIGYFGALDESTWLRQSLVYNSKFNFADMQVTLLRRLVLPFAITMQGYITWVLGVTGCLKAGLQGESGRWSVGVDIHELFLKFHASLKKSISKQSYFTCGLSLESPFNWGFSLGGGSQINKLFRVEFNTEVGHQGVSLILVLKRWGQTFRFPVALYETFSLESALSTVVYSFLSATMINSFVIQPYKALQKKEKLELKKEALERDKVKAAQWTANMQNTIENRRLEEEQKKGLVIIHATYGNLEKRPVFKGTVPVTMVPTDAINDIDENEENDPEIIDVRNQLQYLTENSELHLYNTKKSDLPGFYDPCTGYSNYLEIYYEYKEKMYYLLVEDTDEVHLPEGKIIKSPL